MIARASTTAFLLACAVASNANALEKRARFDTAVPEYEWQSGSSCSIIYYNRCTLWSLAWSGFGDGDRFGVFAENCCDALDFGIVTATQLRVFTGAPAGYGFTGTVAIETVDRSGCPSSVRASQPYLPTGPFDVHFWSQTVHAEFAFVVTTAGEANPAAFGTDHPAAGPTGPQACGFCYPLNRVNHSFVWGSVDSPLCPGRSFHDGVCDAQLRLEMWVVMYDACTVAVTENSWGKIKSLYR